MDLQTEPKKAGGENYSILQLYCFARLGSYPNGISPEVFLTQLPRWNYEVIMTNRHTTLLQIAARHGRFPPGTTHEQLAHADDDADGWTALHEAAKYGHVPQGTPIALMTKMKARCGDTVLHVMAWSGKLPVGIDPKLIMETEDDFGDSVLAVLIEFINHTSRPPRDVLPGWVRAEHLLQTHEAGVTIWSRIKADKLPFVLDMIHAETPAGLRTVGNAIQAVNPVAVARWVMREILRWKASAEAMTRL